MLRRALPPAYLLVSRPDAVRLLYVFVYRDDVKQVKAVRINWCTVIVVAYAACMVLHHLLNTQGVLQWLRHQTHGY